jgi:hypothetical protein
MLQLLQALQEISTSWAPAAVGDVLECLSSFDVGDAEAWLSAAVEGQAAVGLIGSLLEDAREALQASLERMVSACPLCEALNSSAFCFSLIVHVGLRESSR